MRRSVAAIAAVIIALGLTGCGAAETPVPESTYSEPVSLLTGEVGPTFVKPEPVVEAPPAPVVEIPLDESGAPVEQQQAPEPIPAPAPAPAPAPEPVRCPAGSSPTENDGFNDTACMPNVAPNGGSCFEGDNGMLPECQPFRP